MKEYFYYFRDEEKRPLVTVCILSHGDKIARGLAVIGTNGVTDRLSDNPRKIMGRALAKERAYLALLKEETDDKGFWHRHVFFTFLRVFGVKGGSKWTGVPRNPFWDWSFGTPRWFYKPALTLYERKIMFGGLNKCHDTIQ